MLMRLALGHMLQALCDSGLESATVTQFASVLREGSLSPRAPRGIHFFLVDNYLGALRKALPDGTGGETWAALVEPFFQLMGQVEERHRLTRVTEQVVLPLLGARPPSADKTAGEKGEKGEKGEEGKKGGKREKKESGEKGKKGRRGRRGRRGVQGRRGRKVRKGRKERKERWGRKGKRYPDCAPFPFFSQRSRIGCLIWRVILPRVKRTVHTCTICSARPSSERGRPPATVVARRIPTKGV
jgi:hypothetical protein